MSVLLLVLGIVLFIGLVVVHEFGHFIVARRNGVEVEEFGIFFPPRLFKHRTKAGWNFTINLLPLGGFVKLKGEHDTDTEPGTYGAATTWAKTKIMAAGVGMNLLAAILLLMALAWLGMPKLVDNQFTIKSDTKIIKNEILMADVVSGSPAAHAGIQPEDQLVALGPSGHVEQLSSASKLPDITKKYAGQQVTVEYKHKGNLQTKQLTLNTAEAVAASQKTDHPKGYLGVVPTEYTLQRSTWSAPIVALGLTKQFTVLTYQGLWHAIDALGHGNTKQASSQVSGPVGIYVILKSGSLLGYQFVLMIIAVISLTLAIMNILPIPALDGGRLWLTLITRGIKKPLSKEKEELINGLGFVFLLGLIVVITVVDVKRFF